MLAAAAVAAPLKCIINEAGAFVSSWQRRATGSKQPLTLSRNGEGPRHVCFIASLPPRRKYSSILHLALDSHTLIADEKIIDEISV
jgi:hypothetical protein